MHAAEQRWAQLNGCTQVRDTRWIADQVYEEGYAACRDGADVVGRITTGGGHSWVADNDAIVIPGRSEAKNPEPRGSTPLLGVVGAVLRAS